MSSIYATARVGLQAQIDRARRSPQLQHHDLVYWRDECLKIDFTTWMNRSFQGSLRLRFNEICEEARNIPERVAAEAVREKGFPHKGMPHWLWVSGIAAIASSVTLAKIRSRRMGRKREKDVFSESTVSSTRLSLSVNELNNEAETSVTDSVSDQSEREELMEEKRSGHEDGDDDDDDDHDDDETASVQGENEGNDDKKSKSDRSEHGEIKEVTIDESEAMETGNEP